VVARVVRNPAWRGQARHPIEWRAFVFALTVFVYPSRLARQFLYWPASRRLAAIWFPLLVPWWRNLTFDAESGRPHAFAAQLAATLRDQYSQLFGLRLYPAPNTA
jgi:hypothetical protein